MIEKIRSRYFNFTYTYIRIFVSFSVPSYIIDYFTNVDHFPNPNSTDSPRNRNRHFKIKDVIMSIYNRYIDFLV